MRKNDSHLSSSNERNCGRRFRVLLESTFLAALVLTTLAACSSENEQATSGVRPEAVNRQHLPIEKIYKGFQNPPVEARPFIRWWWNNNQVEEDEILRELDVLKAAGIGGIEINPIAGPEPASSSEAKPLVWRSEEWDRLLQVACVGARERGMVVDLIAGSGWPFGGEFLDPEDQIMRVTTVHEPVLGPKVYRKPIGDVLQAATEKTHREERSENPEIQFINIRPAQLTSIAQVRDVTHLVNQDGILEADIDKGPHIVTFGILHRGFRKVVFGVEGAGGPTMDHMDKEVTRAYLNRLRGVEETWGEPLATYVRAIFCDSIETAGANWTDGILESFKDRKGYDISPYLSLVIDPEGFSAPLRKEIQDELRRARYDWNEHIVTVFLENFTAEYARFCHDHNLLSRYQAYGIPWLMGMAEAYMIPDIPETNNWLYSRGNDQFASNSYTWVQDHGYMTWTKYAAAGGRLRGKKIISSEAMTNTRGVFKTPLAAIKQADDMNFIAGVTHSVLHGYNYVPPDIPFPGWIRFGTFFSEHNTWWPYFPLWVEYNSRLSHVFQETQPVPEIALIGPTPDHWSKTGLSRPEFHNEPDYFHRLWEPLSQLGADCDYLHEAAIQSAQATDGKLIIGPMNYKVLMVAGVQSLQPETAEAIQRFAEAGGKVIYIDSVPHRAPSLVNAEIADQRVRAAIEASIEAGAIEQTGPREEADLTTLRQWTRNVLERLDFTSAMRISLPDDALYSIHCQAPDAEVFFFTNTHRQEQLIRRIEFDLGSKSLWRWDPETGQRHLYEKSYDPNGFVIDLLPLESVLLVTGDSRPSGNEQPQRQPYQMPPMMIQSSWDIEFHPAQSEDKFSMTSPELFEFTEHPDPRIRNFSGTATYQTTFSVESPSYSTLNLGWANDFITEVKLNGQKLGVNWYASHPFELSNALQTGKNRLTIRYTTTLWNKMREDKPHQLSGLIGPVTLQ